MVAAFVLLLLGKWGFIDWLVIHGNNLLSQMAQCQFCLSWWANVILTILLCVYVQDFSAHYILIPFVATPITRKFLW